MSCRHEFEKYPTEIVTEIRNAGYGTTRGAQQVLEVDVPCKNCGEEINVRYGLMSIGNRE